MSKYTPDCWVVLKLNSSSNIFYNVLAGWDIYRPDQNNWQLNSGIVGVEKRDGVFIFNGMSGSQYFCNEHCYRLNTLMELLFDEWQEQLRAKRMPPIELMPRGTDWMNFDFKIKIPSKI